MAQNERYSAPSRALHWVSALLIIALFGVGLYMAELPDDAPGRLDLYAMHKSIGILTLVLLAARLVWLRVQPGPELPDAFNAKEKRVTKGVQSLLYLLMVALPLGGWVMSNAAGHPVGFFGLFELPALVGENKPVAGFAHEAHELLGWAIMGFLALHVAGALKHRLANKGGATDVLSRML